MPAPLLALLATLTVLLAACASGPSTPTPSARRPTATPPPATSTPQVTPTPTAAPVTADRLAYVTEDGNINLLRLSDSTDIPLTQPEAGAEAVWHAWPTWDPTGAWIAYSRYVGAGEKEDISLLSRKVDGTETRVLDTRPLGPNDPLVVTGAPYYAQWSPTGKDLAFLAPTGRILSLGLVSNKDGAKAEEVTQGPSINMTWGRRGDTLYLSHGGVLAVVDTAFPIRPAPLGPQSTLSGIPVQSPHSYRVAYLDLSAQGHALFVGDAAAINTGTAKVVLPVPGQAAFLWSPAREVLAVATSPDAGSFEYKALSVVDPESGATRQLVDETLLAFFWSPDGEKIAFVTPADERGAARLKVVPASGGEVQTLATFRPTQDMAVYFSFFDQFAHSHSIWSADSRRLVIALEESGAPSVQVLDAQGVEPPRVVAKGYLAFWSPR